jgi:hypothetical protein
MTTKTRKEVKEVKEVKEEKPLKVTIEFPDGSTTTQELFLRQFQPNIAKGFHNSGYQCKIASGYYTGSIMIIDLLKQVKL